MVTFRLFLLVCLITTTSVYQRSDANARGVKYGTPPPWSITIGDGGRIWIDYVGENALLRLDNICNSFLGMPPLIDANVSYDRGKTWVWEWTEWAYMLNDEETDLYPAIKQIGECDVQISAGVWISGPMKKLLPPFYVYVPYVKDDEDN